MRTFKVELKENQKFRAKMQGKIGFMERKERMIHFVAISQKHLKRK